jgi:hypothetical protein
MSNGGNDRGLYSPQGFALMGWDDGARLAPALA